MPEGTAGSCVHDGLDQSGGVGLAVSQAARSTLADFSIRDNPTVGLLVASAAQVEASRGVISANGVGVAATSAAFDPSALSDEVYVFGNALDIGRRAVEPPRVDTTLRASGP